MYAVWVDRLVTDARSRWDAAELTDGRVTHLWDADNAAGRWLVDHVDDYAGLDWDFYMAFGPDATWSQTPDPLYDAGFTVVAERDQFARTIVALAAATVGS